MSDGCTLFWWAEALFPVRECCVVHDMGGTDGALLYCLMAATPQWTWPVVALCVAAMVLFRPIYHWLKRKGLWPH